ncbi:beta-glucosidase BglX [Pseudoxanthomonas kalamensis DSM 18571]|nr:beta-glucosidase BglX [Pseudoxanthomonas kalamensis DSM 18571]
MIPLLLLAGGLAQARPQGDEAAVVESLIGRMTLDEKLGQLNQPPGPDNRTGPEAEAGGLDQVRRGEVGSFLGLHGAARTCQYQHVAVEETRLGIPLLFAGDVIHGFRTVFPQSIGEAATFDPAAVERSARISATEAAAHGLHWTFAPMVDVARDPRWGRISEGSGEDVYLGKALARARVRGFQGGDPGPALEQALRRDDTVLATAKHFVAYGAAEAGRDYNTTDMSERVLREVYLPPFRAAVEAGAGSVMAAFNDLNGVPMHANKSLIEDVLRKQWGFDGILVSDYTGVWELVKHGVAADETDAGVLALEAGVDIDMVSDIYRRKLPGALREGRVTMAQIDEAVRRVLRAKYRLGLFEDPYRYCDVQREAQRTLTPEFRQAAREVARESMVLLKNEGNVLPLSKDKIRTLAVIGPLADLGKAMIGNWAGDGRPDEAVTPLQGLREALGPEVRILHVGGAQIEGDDRSGFDQAVVAAKQADAVVMFLGEHPDMSGEASSRTRLDLPGVQSQLALAVQAVGKPTAVVLLNGRPLTINTLQENLPAILEAWYPGVEGGRAIADVLFGDYNPAGRLPVSFPRTVGQVPLYYDHKNTGRPIRLNANGTEEKYTSRYLDSPNTPLYPFGYGLSYTQFRYSAPKVKHPTLVAGQAQQVEVTVSNIGSRAGDEVVQLYLRDDVASISRPVRQLRGFRRIHLEPGQSRTLTFVLEAEDMAFLDANLKSTVEPGTFTVFAGGSSEAEQEAKFEVSAK